MAEGQGARRFEMVLGILLVLFGIGFLLMQWLGADLAEDWWPAFIVVPGLAMLAAALAGGEDAAALAIPGCVVTSVGLVLAVQNATGLWETWAWIWPLVAPGSVGVGLAIFGYRAGKREVASVGRKLALAAVVVTIVLGLFFEVFVGLSGLVSPWLRDLALPAALIVLGTWLILWRSRR